MFVRIPSVGVCFHNHAYECATLSHRPTRRRRDSHTTRGGQAAHGTHDTKIYTQHTQVRTRTCVACEPTCDCNDITRNGACSPRSQLHIRLLLSHAYVSTQLATQRMDSCDHLQYDRTRQYDVRGGSVDRTTCTMDSTRIDCASALSSRQSASQ